MARRIGGGAEITPLLSLTLCSPFNDTGQVEQLYVRTVVLQVKDIHIHTHTTHIAESAYFYHSRNAGEGGEFIRC